MSYTVMICVLDADTDVRLATEIRRCKKTECKEIRRYTIPGKKKIFTVSDVSSIRDLNN